MRKQPYRAVLGEEGGDGLPEVGDRRGADDGAIVRLRRREAVSHRKRNQREEEDEKDEDEDKEAKEDEDEDEDEDDEDDDDDNDEDDDDDEGDDQEDDEGEKLRVLAVAPGTCSSAAGRPAAVGQRRALSIIGQLSASWERGSPPPHTHTPTHTHPRTPCVAGCVRGAATRWALRRPCQRKLARATPPRSRTAQPRAWQPMREATRAATPTGFWWGAWPRGARKQRELV